MLQFFLLLYSLVSIRYYAVNIVLFYKGRKVIPLYFLKYFFIRWSNEWIEWVVDLINSTLFIIYYIAQLNRIFFPIFLIEILFMFNQYLSLFYSFIALYLVTKGNYADKYFVMWTTFKIKTYNFKHLQQVT